MTKRREVPLWESLDRVVARLHRLADKEMVPCGQGRYLRTQESREIRRWAEPIEKAIAEMRPPE